MQLLRWLALRTGVAAGQGCRHDWRQISEWTRNVDPQFHYDFPCDMYAYRVNAVLLNQAGTGSDGDVVAVANSYCANSYGTSHAQ